MFSRKRKTNMTVWNSHTNMHSEIKIYLKTPKQNHNYAGFRYIIWEIVFVLFEAVIIIFFLF